MQARPTITPPIPRRFSFACRASVAEPLDADVRSTEHMLLDGQFKKMIAELNYAYVPMRTLLSAISLINALLLATYLVCTAAAATPNDELTALNAKAVQLYQAGKYLEATPLAERALSIRERSLGPDHPLLAPLLNNLAGLYEAGGRYADAEPLYKRAIAIYENSFGADHPNVARTLNGLAVLYSHQGRYNDAERLYVRALAIGEKTLGPDSPDVATWLNNLATLYYNQSRYSDSERLYKRALDIRDKALGPNHLAVGASLNLLASLYYNQGRFAEAEPLYKRALAIVEKALGPDHPDVAISLDNLASLYDAQGRFADAEPLHKRALAILGKAFGPDHPNVATSLNNLALLYHNQGRYAEAEPLYIRSLTIREKSLGSNHPDVANSLNNLAALYQDQGRYADAEPLYKRALAINEKAFGPDDPAVGNSLNNLATLCKNQGRYAEAELFYKRALAINEKAFGSDHPAVGRSLNNLAKLYQYQGRYSDAEPLLKRALSINEKALGANHPIVGTLLFNLASLYQDEGRYSDAEPVLKRALTIREEALGPNHPDVATSLDTLATLYQDQGRHAEAEPLFKRALAIREKALGTDHPDVATSLNNLALLYHNQGRDADAEPLLKRALSINEKALGANHPDVASSLNNLATLYLDQGRYADAELFYRRSLASWEKALGPDHPNVVTALNNLAALYGNQHRYSEALPLIQTTISHKRAATWAALPVLFGAQSENLISPDEALDESLNVVQRASHTSAGQALNALAARFSAGPGRLAELVRKDQDLAAEAESLDKAIIAAVAKEPSRRDAAAEQKIKDRIAAVAKEREDIGKIFARDFPDYAALSRPEPLMVKDIQPLLANNEALIIVDVGATSYVWVITANRAEWRQLSVSADDVSKEVATLRAALDPDSSKPFDRKLAYQLCEQVLGPIEGVISEKTRLSFVLSGALTSLPPQVLLTSDPEGKELASVDWLTRKYAITVLPSVTSLKILRSGRAALAAAKPMIGFGDPVFERQPTAKPQVASFGKSLTSFYRGVIPDTKALAEALPQLPETADELHAVAKELGARSGDIRLGEAATVTNVKHAPLDDYRVVYFATHALVAGEVEKFAKVKAEPALVLTMPDKPSDEDDGLLRASDVAMLKMNADFVVLSACNTAAGDKPGAEALSGLARAFFYAGARSLIVSNWEVDSESTVALMTGLFGELKANPHLSHAEAQRLAILKMIDHPAKPEWAEPKYWAPFIVVGEPQKN